MASTIHVASDPVRRVSAEFLEMPGLRLTIPQACRLFSLPSTECQSLLATLVDRGFLIRTREGHYIRPVVRQSRA
jgi:DNA-binding IclR family transcriptional regulator